MQAKICNTCGKPMKKLKHSILCDCGPRILTDRHAVKEKK
ncbi:DNA-directed RNA polymerase subunit RPC12/RpoP [Peribacillus cavernae]|nr:DNA-directed RNA polymerase subunit RPC12/RpoP [Peribacillus cavernae]